MLDDIVVVELSRALAGPYAGMMLGDLGARVIKVESPEGDESRRWGPPFVADSRGDQVSTYFLSCNRNKESVTCDLKTPQGRELLARLIRRADVLIENFRPGVLDRLGFDQTTLEGLNPRLVSCSISGFGHDGPEGGRSGYDQIAQGEAGIMSLTGEPGGPPMKAGVSLGDISAGMFAAFGVASALRDRELTGRGRHVRTSLLAGLVGLHAFQGTRWTVAGEVPGALGNHHPSIAPYGLFNAKDGPVQIAIGNDEQWETFCRLAGIVDSSSRFASNSERVAHRDELIRVIEAALATHTSQHWSDALSGAGIPVGRVRTLDQVYDWDQTRSQGLVVDVPHPTLGTVALPGSALRYDEQAYAGDRKANTAPPLLGEHNESVGAWLDGLDEGGTRPADGED
jgi:crotonobetainyl-CoA:carnitine CoA-transferase CaiB-like acyl-CoA transferase